MQRKTAKSKNMAKRLSKKIEKLIPKFQNYFATQPIQNAYLFGSCSRGEEKKHSDVDVMVTYDPSQRVSLLKVSQIMLELQQIAKRKVDLAEVGFIKPFALSSVEKDKILIYERAN